MDAPIPQPRVSPAAAGHWAHPVEVDFLHRVFFTRRLLDPGNPLLARPLSECAPHMVAVVDQGFLDANPTFPAQLRAYLAAHPGLPTLHALRSVPGGERAKNDRAVVDLTLDLINTHHICRQSVVLAVGGGALLDAVGFGAATGHRGVRVVRLPTTVLAQDDAAMGVKCGINRYGKKNFEGAFAVPWAVLCDLEWLTTLPESAWRGGFSEAVKIALLRDPGLFTHLESCAAAIRGRSLETALPVIQRSAELHLLHITQGGDPFELNEARPLDYGHWAAHKLEQLTGFTLSHGEAVGIGVALDTWYSSLCGWLPDAAAARVVACLRNLGLATWHPALEEPALVSGLDEFKEHLGGRLTVTLLRGIGQPQETHSMDPELIRTAIATLARSEAP